MRTPMETLVHYLQAQRDAVLWKLDGLSEYDARRPLTPTGTNILGLVKHLAFVEGGYFGESFGRPFPDLAPYSELDDPHADLWVEPDQSRADVVNLYRAVWAHAAETFADSTLETRARVPWWGGDAAETTLHQLLVHVIAETARHAGHIDILREQIDERAGLREGGTNLPEDYDWPAYVARVQAAAEGFRG